MYFLSTFCGVCLTDRREVQNIHNKDTDDISLAEKLKYCSFKTVSIFEINFISSEINKIWCYSVEIIYYILISIVYNCPKCYLKLLTSNLFITCCFRLGLMMIYRYLFATSAIMI